MLKKGDVFKVSDLTYGVSKTHGAWAMVKTKVEKDKGVKRKSGIVTVWVKNPEEIRNAKEFRVDDILEVLDISAKELRDSAEGQLAASVLQDCVFHGFAYKNGFVMSDEEFAEGTAGYIADNGYNDLDDLLSTSGLSLADVRELVNMDYLSNRLADMVTIKK